MSRGNIHAFIESLTTVERHLLKNRLSSQIDQYFNSSNKLKKLSTKKLLAFNELSDTLRLLTPNSKIIPKNGIVYHGNPRWLTKKLLLELQKEAVFRKEKPLDRTDHFLGCGGKIADKLSVSEQLLRFVSKNAGANASIRCTGIASYLYYERHGDGIRPHIDTEVFSLNMIIMLKHTCPAKYNPSSTVVFPAFSKPEYYNLEVGGVLLMYGSSVIHTRSIINPSEEVHLLTIGFNLINQNEQ